MTLIHPTGPGSIAPFENTGATSISIQGYAPDIWTNYTSTGFNIGPKDPLEFNLFARYNPKTTSEKSIVFELDLDSLKIYELDAAESKILRVSIRYGDIKEFLARAEQTFIPIEQIQKLNLELELLQQQLKITRLEEQIRIQENLKEEIIALKQQVQKYEEYFKERAKYLDHLQID